MLRSGILTIRVTCLAVLLGATAPSVAQEAVVDDPAPAAEAAQAEAFDPVESTAPAETAEGPAANDAVEASEPPAEQATTDAETEQPVQEGTLQDAPVEVEDTTAEPVDEVDEAPAAEDAEAGTDWAGLMERAPAFFALTHHAAVHLPIALWLFGAFFVVIGVVAPSLRNQIPLACLIGGAVTSLGAVASGWWYAEYEYGDAWDWETGLGDIDWSEQLTQHRWTGVALVAASCLLSVIAVISVNREGWKMAWFWRLGLIALAAAVAWEGHIGGELIHGEGFLEEAFQEWVSPEAE